MGDGDTLRKKYEQDIQEKEVTLAVLRSELQSLQAFPLLLHFVIYKGGLYSSRGNSKEAS